MKGKIRKFGLYRIYYYARIGYSNWISWWAAPAAYLTILYSLIVKPLIPNINGFYIYPLLYLTVLLLSFLVGYLGINLAKFYKREAEISGESNPYYDLMLKQMLTTLDSNIASNEAAIDFYKSKGSDVQRLMENTQKMQQLRLEIVNALEKFIH